MKTIFHSLTSKFLVNVIMIFFFGISSVTGIFHIGEEGHERNHDFTNNQTISTDTPAVYPASVSEQNQLDNSESNFRPEKKDNDVHIYFGLLWILLMIFHIVQNWSWFKKITTITHILRNKLTTLITIIFILLALSGILLWIDIIPRNVFNIKEIHDVTGKLLFALIIIHIIQRIKWYVNVPRVLIKQKSMAN